MRDGLGMNNSWSHEFVLASRERALGRTPELLAALRSGELHRVSRGVYRHTSARTADAHRRADDDYLAQIRAAQLRADGPLLLSGMSAAAVWELPVVGAWPARVHTAAAPDAGGRSNGHLSRSYVGFPPPTAEREGLLVTSLPRTVADVARVETMERAVAIADAALAGQRRTPTRSARAAITKDSVLQQLEVVGAVGGVARARGVLSFADSRSGSAGESCSRVGMWRLRMPAPVLQEAFYDERGKIGVVDFWWPDCKLVGEFDGRGKYLRDEYLSGRSTADAVLAEKAREDRLRALGLTIVRWDWATALDLALLEAKLRGAGLR